MQIRREDVCFTIGVLPRASVGQADIGRFGLRHFSRFFQVLVEMPVDRIQRLPTCPLEESLLSSTTIPPRCGA
jgi:hypothetical protein